jgi:hypothetical protein
MPKKLLVTLDDTPGNALALLFLLRAFRFRKLLANKLLVIVNSKDAICRMKSICDVVLRGVPVVEHDAEEVAAFTTEKFWVLLLATWKLSRTDVKWEKCVGFYIVGGMDVSGVLTDNLDIDLVDALTIRRIPCLMFGPVLYATTMLRNRWIDETTLPHVWKAIERDKSDEMNLFKVIYESEEKAEKTEKTDGVENQIKIDAIPVLCAAVWTNGRAITMIGQSVRVERKDKPRFVHDKSSYLHDVQCIMHEWLESTFVELIENRVGV